MEYREGGLLILYSSEQFEFFTMSISYQEQY